MYRAYRGCKGVGRLLWLKAFNSVEIKSCYLENETKKSRHFSFTTQGITSLDDFDISNDSIGTTIILKGLNSQYKQSISNHSQESFAKAIFEHCLWFFLRRGSCPDIRIIEFENTDEAVNLNDIYDSYIYSDATYNVPFKIGEQEFNILHVKLHKSESNNVISYCAGNRIVTDEKIKNIVGLYNSAISGEQGDFYYKCFVTSTYLDLKVSADRFSFLIPAKREEGSEENIEEEIYFSDIQEKVLSSVKEYLHPYLQDNISAGKEKMQEFVDKQAPYYKPILSSLSEEEKVINPSSTNKVIELYLHSKMVDKEHILIEEGHDILSLREGETDDNYEERVSAYFKNAQQLKQTDLARYVLHRKYILELLKEALKKDENGNYCKENRVHEIIMPMQKTSDDKEFSNNNLWIIDERLVFHHFLASDRSFKSMPTTSCDSTRRPDIFVENIFDNPIVVSERPNPPFATLRIVEFKRPMRDDMKPDDDTKNPIDQCLDYVEKIRTEKCTTKDGRPFNISNSIPAYCYIICDLTPSMISICRKNDLRKTYDNLGYFGYKTELQIYFEVISFNQMLNSANERNASFFEILGLPHD